MVEGEGRCGEGREGERRAGEEREGEGRRVEGRREGRERRSGVGCAVQRALHHKEGAEIPLANTTVTPPHERRGKGEEEGEGGREERYGGIARGVERRWRRRTEGGRGEGEGGEERSWGVEERPQQ